MTEWDTPYKAIAALVALKEDVKEMKADLKTLLRRSTDQVKR